MAGPAVGDALLCAFARRLRDAPALSGNLSRVHADTFACLIAGDGVDALCLQVEKLLPGPLDREFQVGEQAATVERTVAVAVLPGDGRDGETLLSNAVTALRKAKAARVPLAYHESAMNARVAETLQLEYRLRQALERDQLALHYQPKVDPAHSLHLVVIAEGVGTEARAAILRRLDGDLMQGYLVSKPVPVDALAALPPAPASATR